MEMMNSAGGGGGNAVMGYADSVDSSPRSRGGESWDEPFSSLATVTGSKLRLMCSYGGRIVPRPTDRSLCYLGGDTRIVVVERHTTLNDLSAKLSRSLIGGRSFTLKYQLPNEDLDSLISVTTDEDLDNMIDEYDRLVSTSSSGGGSGPSRSSRLRLFLFPSKPDSAPSSIGSLLDDSKSENWFVDALNGAIGMDGLPRGLSSDSTSVNCLLGLEDDLSLKSRSGISPLGAASSTTGPPDHERLVLPRSESSGKLTRQGIDVNSVPDSPMVDTTSSFGSTSSAPYLSNLPPIRIRPDDRPQEQRIGGLEEHFSQMNISAATGMAAVAASGQRLPDDVGIKDTSFPFHNPPLTNPLPTSAISPTENSNRKTFSSDDEKSDQVAINMPLPPQQLLQQPPPPSQPMFNPMDSAPLEPIPRPIYYQERVSPSAAAVNPTPDPKREAPAPPTTNYVLTEQQFRQHLSQTHHLQQLQQQQQPQYITSNPNPNQQYFQHPATSTVYPFPAYYQMPIQQSQQPHQFDQQQQFPVYYLPVRQNLTQPQPYHIPLAPPLSDPQGKPAATFSKPLPSKPDLQANLYRMPAMAPPVQNSAAAMAPPQPPQPSLIHMTSDPGQYSGMGYHVMHHHHPSQMPPASTTVAANYGYEYGTDQAGNPQVYFTQTTSPPGIAPQQYQTVVTSPDAAAVAAAAVTGEAKQTRAS